MWNSLSSNGWSRWVGRSRTGRFVRGDDRGVGRQPAVDAGVRVLADAVDRPEPFVDGAGEVGLGAHPQFERDVGDADPVPVDQRLELTQPLDLTGRVEPVPPG